MKAKIAYVALGSNLDNPKQHILSALLALDDLPDTQKHKQSSLYRSPSLLKGQPDYINAVVALKTHLLADRLLSCLLDLEKAHGRVRKVRWGPRTLDCDIILYEKMCIDRPHLKIPHPQMTQRPFVLLPLWEIAPDLILPNGQPLATYLLAQTGNGIEKIECEEM